MATDTTLAELRKMQLSDLLREMKELSTSVAKLRLTVRLGQEKDTAKYQRAKKQLARYKTIVTEKQAIMLSEQKAAATVAAPTDSDAASGSEKSTKAGRVSSDKS